MVWGPLARSGLRARDAVAVPKPETISGQVMVTVGWQVLAPGPDPPADGPDLDLSGLFQATEDEGATEGQPQSAQ